MRGRGRVISGALVSAGVCSVLTVAAATAGAGAAAAAAVAARGSGTHPVIIFLKNQLSGAGSRIRADKRTALIQAAQAPYVGQLQALGATDVHGYRLVDAISAHVPASSLAAIGGNPGVASVIPDSPIAGPAPAMSPGGTALAGSAGKDAAAVKAPPGACSAAPQLTPEGLALTHTDGAVNGAKTARSLGFTGAGVKVAFLADGIDTANANLMRGREPAISA